MVCIRNLTGLLLALAAAPSVLATPGAVNDVEIIAREPQLGQLLGGGDDGSSSALPSASPSDSPSNSPTQATTSAIQTSSVVTSNSPSQTPTTAQAHTTSAPQTSIPVTTSVDFALTTVTPSGSQSAVVVYRTLTTITGGQVQTAEVSSTVAAATSSPSSDSSGHSGPTVSTGTIVGAAVGGTGGLILIAGLAAVAWRIWGKNRRRSDEDDELMGDGIYGTSEVKASGPTTGASPFQSNLEQYHNGRSNPSANF